MTKSKILCIEDDTVMQALIQSSLRDYDVTVAGTLVAAEKQLAEGSFEFLIIDIELPDGDGLKYWESSRTKFHNPEMPVIFLTSNDEISNKVMAFSIGADDFVSKPFNPIELKLRVARRLETKKPTTHQTVRNIGELTVDLTTQQAWHNKIAGKSLLSLTAIEFKILIFFSKELDRIYSRQEILNAVWGDAFISDRTIDSHIAHLRTKIASSNVMIESVRSVGYQLSISSRMASKI